MWSQLSCFLVSWAGVLRSIGLALMGSALLMVTLPSCIFLSLQESEVALVEYRRDGMTVKGFQQGPENASIFPDITKWLGLCRWISGPHQSPEASYCAQHLGAFARATCPGLHCQLSPPSRNGCVKCSITGT